MQVKPFLLAVAAVLLLAAAPGRDGAFDTTAHPAAPDYGQRTDWAIWRGGNTSSPVDLFFIPPTTFVSQRWNQDLSDTQTDHWTRISVANRQINAFDDCCRIYSPRYRQASSRAFGEMAGDGAKAYALAYQDVRAAFRWYIAHENHGRPFVIAAHSQGSLHALRLLEEEIDGTPLAVGWWRSMRRGSAFRAACSARCLRRSCRATPRRAPTASPAGTAIPRRRMRVASCNARSGDPRVAKMACFASIR